MTTRPALPGSSRASARSPKRHVITPVPGLNKHAEVRHPWYLQPERILRVGRGGKPVCADGTQAHHIIDRLCAERDGLHDLAEKIPEEDDIGGRWAICTRCEWLEWWPAYSVALPDNADD